MSTPTRMIRIALSLAGCAIFVLIVIWGIGDGKFIKPVGGDIPTIFQPAGDAFRSGQPVYAWKDLPFFYAPPLVIVFAALSWLPTPVLFTGILIADVVALRYMARGWLRVGHLLWYVVLPFEFAAGQMNIIIAAIGLLLVATRTRLGRVSGAVIATPAFYWGSLVLFLAPMAIGFDLWDERRARRARPPARETQVTRPGPTEAPAPD